MQDCQTAVGYQSATSRPCNVFSCRNNADCSGNGVCSSGACQCFTGYTGASCSVSFGPCPDVPAARSPTTAPSLPTEAVAPMPAPSLSSTTPLCCPTGVVDHQGTCCKSGTVGLILSVLPHASQVKMTSSTCHQQAAYAVRNSKSNARQDTSMYIGQAERCKRQRFCLAVRMHCLVMQHWWLARGTAAQKAPRSTT